MTLNEIVFTISERLGSPNDFALQAQLKDDVVGWRATLLHQHYTRNHSWDSDLQQTLGYIPLERVDAASETTSRVVGYNVLRSKDLIPAGLRLKNSRIPSYTYVGSPTGLNAFGYIDPGRAPFLRKGSSARWTRRNGRIYIYNAAADEVLVRAILDDPRKAAEFSDYTQSDCYTDDSEFPVPFDLRQIIIKTIVDERTGEDHDTDEEVKDIALNDRS